MWWTIARSGRIDSWLHQKHACGWLKSDIYTFIFKSKFVSASLHFDCIGILVVDSRNHVLFSKKYMPCLPATMKWTPFILHSIFNFKYLLQLIPLCIALNRYTQNYLPSHKQQLRKTQQWLRNLSEGNVTNWLTHNKCNLFLRKKWSIIFSLCNWR